MRVRKKLVEVEAIQFLGKDSFKEMINEWPEFIKVAKFFTGNSEIEMSLSIETLEGTHKGIIGDFIIKGIKGEFYPCKKDIFEATYEAIN